MNSFLARIELHNAHGLDYIELHERMKAQGYTRTIRSGDGIDYQLPTAEYEIRGGLTCNDALQRAKAAAAGTGKSYGAIVVDYSKAQWYGLSLA